MTRYGKYNQDLRGGEVIGCCLLVIVGIIAYFAIVSFVFQWLWNLVVPSLFNGPVLDYGQALAIVGLLSIISGFFRSSFSAKD